MSRARVAALGLVFAASLSACGAPPRAAASRFPVAVAALPAPSPSPADLIAASPSAAATVAPPAAAQPVAPVAMAPAASETFRLVAVGDPGARGTVTVTMLSGRAVVDVIATGLPPGSVHSVHVHFGLCPSTGSHILVLGTLRADAGGSGRITGAINPAFSGPGHFVIVYVGPGAGPIGACADLG